MQQVQFSVEVPGLDLLRDLLAKSAACCLQVHVSVYFFGGAWCRESYNKIGCARTA